MRTARTVALAAVLSGAPSTAWALMTGRDVLAPARAAGALLGKATLPRGLAAHAMVSAFWGVVLARTLAPRRHPVAWGAAAGAAIHLLDMRVVGRRVEAIAALAEGPQLADHVVFGAVIGWRTRPRGPAPRR